MRDATLQKRLNEYLAQPSESTLTKLQESADKHFMKWLETAPEPPEANE